MAIKRFLQGIAIVALMIGAIFTVMAEAPTIAFVAPTPDNGTINANFINVSVTLGSSGGVAILNWNSVNESMDGSGTQFYKNKTVTNQVYVFYVRANEINSSNWTTSPTRTVTVNVPSPAPVLNSSTPSSPVSSQFNSTQTFSVTVDQLANVSWKIGGTEVQNLSVPAMGTSGYSNNNSAVGSYSVTATAINSNGSSTVNWTWTVLAPPGPPPVSGLSYTKGVSWINWTWTNISTGDFNHTIVKINSVFQTNTSFNYFNHSPIALGTSYSISLQTVDTSGNINSTVISNSTSTLNTAIGTNVLVDLSGVKVTFSNVTKEGDTNKTSFSVTDNGSLFTIAGTAYNITTTAQFVGNATVEMSFSSSNPSIVNLYHFDGSWKDVTTGRNADKVWGNVTTFSPFVPGLPPAPTITKETPNTPIESKVNEFITFIVHADQRSNITWKLDGTQVQNNYSVDANVQAIYVASGSKGPHTVTVIATNTTTSTSDTKYWNWTVRPATFSSGNRIWDGSKRDDFALTYSWTPMSFSGFYYNSKDDVGNENITITLKDYTTRTILEKNLVYTTSPQEVSFAATKFGKYQVIGFMAEKYFAGYNQNTTPPNPKPSTTFDGISAVGQGQLHKVLIDDDTKRTISVGGTIALQEGYVLKATDIDLNARTMLLSLLKDGAEVDVSPLSANQTYVYTKKVGGVDPLPLIMVRFDSVFSGQELQVAFMKGMFQISEYPTIIKTGNTFRNMEVTQVSSNLIQMKNNNDIGLTKGTTADVMGDVKILIANNDSVLRFALSVEKTGSFEIRSTVYKGDDANPVLEWTPYNFGMNIGKTSIGFYYDLDEGIGGEKLTLKSTVSGNIPDEKLEYSTTPQPVKFIYTGFGKYNVIGFMADKYFAGYTSDTGISGSRRIITRPSTDFDGKSTLANGALHKVLIDDDTKRTISVGGTIALKEGYVIKATDIDLKARVMLLSLLKDGAEVDITPLGAGETYIYTKTVGGTEALPLIMVRFENVFSGQELQVAFLKGIFQISDTPTVVKVADQFGKMEVRSVSASEIKMSNDGSIGLDKNKNEVLMGNLRLKTADNDKLRFYFAVDVTADMIQNQLVIDAPTKAMAGDTIMIKVKAGGIGIGNATINIGTETGTTDNNGILNYTLPRSLKGTYSITASMTGYEKATQNIEIEKYVDLRLSIEAPSQSNQFETITIKVLYNGTAMSGASVKFDNTTVGTSDSNGELTYKLETSGTHTISASKQSYVTVTREIEIRAPYSEFKALDINITPNSGFTGEEFLVKSNIANVGTMSDSMQVELIVNGTAVDNKTITLGAKEKIEVNFTRIEEIPGNVTVEIMGQSILYEAKEKPTNYLLIGVIATALGALGIYILTSKGLIDLGLLKHKFSLLAEKISGLFKK